MFAGRVAFVTGASRGVGKAIALALARNGCDIVVAAKTVAPDPRLPGTIHETAREIEALGRRALPLPMDVRDDGAVERAVKGALDKLGRVDFLVNNAGALYWQSLVDTPMKKFDLVMDVNVRGAFACARQVLPAMRAQKFGHILMMSPPVDPHATGGKIGYAISKFGMTLIAHGLADEVRDDNVAANALWPVTMIESLATINWGLGDRSLWRKPDILADATVRIFAKEPRTFTGHALLDEDFLRDEGITDFSGYRADPAHEPPRIGFDFRATAGVKGAGSS
ncbi:MAG TPA: SDR family oxidoreductase [Polyangia bacterium]|jgi:citronellol/citronellal dehydrogenase|nr:SDR family oxidoreductase [Polyangia bacterium]